jgi:hypothetical protein
MSDMFEGERLPVQLAIMDGQYVNRTLVVTGSSSELGRKPISLLLDSGVNYLYLFGGEQSLGGGGVTQRECTAGTISDPSNQFICIQKVLSELRFGNKTVVSLIAVAQQRTTRAYTEGLMPTSAFHSIFISHSQRFVILDPSSKPKPAGRGMLGG